MPLYEITCQTCKQDSEILVLNEDDMVCPECGSRNVKTNISVGSFVYNGDFRSYLPSTDKKFWGEK